MASVSYEPGDGSFEIILKKDEPFPVEWNIDGAVVLRENEDGSYRIVKDYGETLVGLKT